MKETRIEERLACKLEDDELLEAGRRLAACHTRLEEHAVEVAAARKASKDAAARLEAERNELVEQLVKGVAWRYVPTLERFDLAQGTVRVVRLDTHETVRERDMTQAEVRALRQTELDLEAGSTGVEGLDELGEARCRLCGCTEDDCSACVRRTGGPCEWIEADLCSACVVDLEAPSRLRREIHRWPAVEGLEGDDLLTALFLEDHKDQALELVELLEAGLEAVTFEPLQVLELRDRRRDLLTVAGALDVERRTFGQSILEQATPRGTLVELCDLVRRYLGLAVADSTVDDDLRDELLEDLELSVAEPDQVLEAGPLDQVVELLEAVVRDVDEMVGDVHVPVEALVVALDDTGEGLADVTVALRRYGSKRPEPTKKQIRALESLLATVDGVSVNVAGASTHREILAAGPTWSAEGVQVLELEIDRLRTEGAVQAAGLDVGTVEGLVGAVRAIPFLNGSDLNGPVGEDFDQVDVELLAVGLLSVKVGQKDRPLTALERDAIGWAVNVVREDGTDFRFVDLGAGATLTPGNELRSVRGPDLGEVLTAELLEAFGGRRLELEANGAGSVTPEELRTWLADRVEQSVIASRSVRLLERLVVERDPEDRSRVVVQFPEALAEDLDALRATGDFLDAAGPA